MKINKVFIVSILMFMVILTVGTVSASENATVGELTSSDVDLQDYSIADSDSSAVDLSASGVETQLSSNTPEAEISANQTVSAEPKSTSMSVTCINGLKLTANLKDGDNNPISGANIKYSIDNVDKDIKTTDSNGDVIINVKSNIVLSLVFEGSEGYNASTATVTLKNIDPILKSTQITVDKAFTRTAVDFPAGEKGQMFYFTLKDQDKKVLANKEVKIGVSGKIYTVKTDKNGKAGLMINLANANVYTYAISFLGDDDYKASFEVSKLTVVKKPVTITPAKTSYTFKSSAKSKVITTTLKSSNKYIPSGKKVTVAVGGKTYSATIAKNGKISLNIGTLTKKGAYKISIKYAGDVTYKAATSKTITVKIN